MARARWENRARSGLERCRSRSRRRGGTRRPGPARSRRGSPTPPVRPPASTGSQVMSSGFGYAGARLIIFRIVIRSPSNDPAARMLSSRPLELLARHGHLPPRRSICCRLRTEERRARSAVRQASSSAFVRVLEPKTSTMAIRISASMSTSPSSRRLEHRRHPPAPPVGDGRTVLSQRSLDGFDPHPHQRAAGEVHLGVAAQPAPQREPGRHLGEVARRPRTRPGSLARPSPGRSPRCRRSTCRTSRATPRRPGRRRRSGAPGSPARRSGRWPPPRIDPRARLPGRAASASSSRARSKIVLRLGAEAQDRRPRARSGAAWTFTPGSGTEQRSVHDVGERQRRPVRGRSARVPRRGGSTCG